MDCAACGRANPAEAILCTGCGHVLASRAVPGRPGGPAGDADVTESGERRQLTVMFCDLVESTPLSASLDAEDLAAVIRSFEETCAEAIEDLGGYVAQLLGDGILAYFGHPQADEDDAARAVSAGLRIVEAVPALNARLAAEFPLLRDRPLQMRIGVHTGPVLLGDVGRGRRRERLALGSTPPLTFRLLHEAAPGWVVISDATQRLLRRGRFELEDLGVRQLRGFDRPVRVHRAVRALPLRDVLDVPAAPETTPFVGRERELDLLLDSWQRTRDGDGRAVLVSGEPGIGKSRLVQAFREQLAGDAHQWVECRGSPFHVHSALHPVLASFERGLRFGPDDAPESKLAKLELALEPSGFTPSEVMPLFAHLLSLPLPQDYSTARLSPEARRQRALECLTRWPLKLTERAPVVLVVEDLQWFDASSSELLGMLLDRIRGVRILVLGTARPEFKPAWREGASELALEPLSRAAMASLVRGLPEAQALRASVVDEIVSTADGVPLFGEELTRSVLGSREQAARGGDGTPMPIPSTLRDSLMGRLDRLGEAKGVAQLAAVLGREFPIDLLLAISSLQPAWLRHALAQLEGSGVLRRQGSSTPTYAFKHALIHEAAYDSLPRNRRRRLHAAAVQALEGPLSDRVAAEPEIVARHCEFAGMAARAVSHCRRAGERALGASAHVEAIGHFEKAIELIGDLPTDPARNREELALQVDLGASLLAARGYGSADVERCHERARELCEGMEEGPALYQALGGLFLFHLARAELSTAEELAAMLLALGERSGDPFVRQWGHFFSAARHYYAGRFRSAYEHAERAIELHVAERPHGWYVHEHDPDISGRVYAAFSLWNLGQPDRALGRMNEAIALGREDPHPWNQAFVLGFAAMLHHLRRERAHVEALAREVISIAERQAFPFWLGMGRVLHGWARAVSETGDEGGIAEILEGLAAGASTGTKIGGPRTLGLLAEAQHALGRPGEAREMLRAALGMSASTGNVFWDAELHRLRGEVLLAEDPRAGEEASRCFEQALALAGEQEARSLALRAAASLERLRQRQGAAERSPDLGVLYAGFSEGFETADLREARRLLDARGPADGATGERA